MANTVKSSGKSSGRPFTRNDPRRCKTAKGPAKGAANAGRPKDEVKAKLAACRELAAEQTLDDLQHGRADIDHRIKIVEKFKDDTHGPGVGGWFFQLLPAQSLEEWAKGQPGILGK